MRFEAAIVSRISIHPTSLLLAWIVFALAIPHFNVETMLAASVLVVAMMIYSGFNRCWQLLRRTRILLITLLVVYAFMTPGTPLFPGWEQASPSYEGWMAGLQQVWRLLLMIGTLAALLAYLSRQQLLAGIYCLLLPFQPMGVPVERFAVRLWLTLHYVETMPKSFDLGAHWDNAVALPQQLEQSINLDVQHFGIQDAIFALACFTLLGWALW